GKDRVVPDLVIDGQPDEPTKQQVVANLLHQLPLAANGEEHLDQHCPQQLLGCNRCSPCLGVDGIEQPVQACQRLVDHPVNGSQRMVCRHEVVELGQREQAFLHSI